MTMPPAPARRVVLLINPAAGRHDPAGLDRLAEALRRRGLEAEIVVGRSPGDLATRAATSEADIVAVSGGDGTVNDVVGALASRTGRRPLLAVIPNGTANVLAHEHRLPTAPEAIAAAIAAGRTRPLHLGTARSDGEAARPFVLMASAGLDAAIVHAVERRRPRRFKKSVFVVEALRRVFAARPRLVAEIETEAGERLRIDCALAIVAKAAHYGGPHRLTVATASERPGLRFVALLDDRPSRLAEAAARLAVGRLEGSANVVSLAVTRVRLTAAAVGDVPVQIDGEPHGTTPIEVWASPAALDLIVAADPV